MSSGFEYTVHEGSLEGPVVGSYRHNETSNDLTRPKRGDIIELDGLYGRWRVTDGHPLGAARDVVSSQETGELVAERVPDELAPHSD